MGWFGRMWRGLASRFSSASGRWVEKIGIMSPDFPARCSSTECEKEEKIGILSPDYTVPRILCYFRVSSLFLFMLFIIHSELMPSRIYKSVLLVLSYLYGVQFSLLLQDKYHPPHAAHWLLHFIPMENTLYSNFRVALIEYRRYVLKRKLWVYFTVSACIVICLSVFAYFTQNAIQKRIVFATILFGVSIGYELFLRSIDAKAKMACLSFSAILIYLSLAVFLINWNFPHVILFLSHALLYYVVIESHSRSLTLRRNDNAL